MFQLYMASKLKARCHISKMCNIKFITVISSFYDTWHQIWICDVIFLWGNGTLTMMSEWHHSQATFLSQKFYVKENVYAISSQKSDAMFQLYMESELKARCHISKMRSLKIITVIASLYDTWHRIWICDVILLWGNVTLTMMSEWQLSQSALLSR